MADELEITLDESAAALLEFKNGRKLPATPLLDEMKLKQEETPPDEDEEEDEKEDMDDMETEDDVPKLGPAALGLQRVGTPSTPKQSSTQPVQVLNARGMPARIRKKNKLYYDDDIINTPHHRVPSAKKQLAPTPTKTPTPTKKPKIVTPIKSVPKMVPKSTPRKVVVKDSKSPSHQNTVLTPPPVQDQKIGQKIGMRLRNLLKLPKAHKWVCYEWFYSNIDRCLFSGENDFTICLRETFPELKTRELTRVEWTKIRRMMGKPRRCSQAFFDEERLELERKRNKIRALQQRKATDMLTFKDLPAEIPMQLVIGTKVTARLRKPQDGLFTGSIDAVDTSDSTYRITFERQGLGTHSVPDYEVLSNEPPDTMTIASFQNKRRSRNGLSPMTPLSKSSPGSTLKLKRDPLLSGSVFVKPFIPNVRMEAFTPDSCPPKDLLQKMVFVTKILNVKRSKIKQLRCMNTEAEKFSSFDTDVPEDFERRYAGILIDLERLNHELETYLDEMQLLCREIAPEPSVAAMLVPSHLREKCREEAMEIVHRNNNIIAADQGPVTSEAILELITDFTALLLQVKSLASSDQNAYELQVLQGTIEMIKRKLSPDTQVVYEDNVEVHMKYIQVELGNTNNSTNSSTSSSSSSISNGVNGNQ